MMRDHASSSYVIPFNRPCFTGKELDYIAEAIRYGWVSGDGLFSARTHGLLEAVLGVPKVLLTPSCTHALEMAALVLDIQPGDEVIVPSFTFVSTANAFVLRGAKPVFIDIRPDTLNLDESLVESLLTERTRAVVPVHYAGVGCELETILAMAKARGIAVVEDNAHGLFGKYRNQWLGTFGGMATLSFHETKNFTCGEGGALLINDPAYIEQAEIIREKGTNRSRFFRGEVDKYTWVSVGSSYLPSDVLAAFLFAQLEARAQIQEKRRQIWDTYFARLGPWAAQHEVRLPCVPEHCDQSYHMFYMILPSEAARTALIAHLKAQGILSVFHYVPLHRSPMGHTLGSRDGDCPVTEDISARLVRLPFFNDLKASEQEMVVDAVCAFAP
jgi:dTDP-4-amino-4,6-dideoxygalactose transaminase